MLLIGNFRIFTFVKNIFLLALTLLNCGLSQAQKEDYVWHVGYSSFMDFNSGAATTFFANGPIALDYTNASICDSAGNLIIYTNGVTLCNNVNDTLLNGTNLNPCSFTSTWAGAGLPISQADIIIQRPDHPNYYYLFHETCDNPFGGYFMTNVLYLSVIDMSLDSGRGGVTNIKNFHLYQNDTLHIGNLSAVKHANGRDWWLLTKKLISPIFYKWLIMPDTIIGPIIQSNQIGSAYNPGPGFGQSVFSPQGDKYGVIYNNKNFYLYDFNRCTGELNYLFQEYYNDSSLFGSGCAFSASGRYLYVSTEKLIYQYDMNAGNIQASKVVVAVYDGFMLPVATHFNQMRLAPDEKIYISTDNGVYVFHVIEYPDSAGLACNVMQHSFYLPGPPSASVPNIPDYKLGPLNDSGCDTILNIWYLEKNNFSILAYPNPSKGDFTLKFNCANETHYSLSVKDILGRLLVNVNDKAIKGINIKTMDLTLAEGIYFINVKSFNMNETIRIAVENH